MDPNSEWTQGVRGVIIAASSQLVEFILSTNIVTSVGAALRTIDARSYNSSTSYA